MVKVSEKPRQTGVTPTLPVRRVRELMAGVPKARLTVAGDVMLDHFIWGRVSRISPEAPVPVVEFDHEESMAGGAANVARNLTSLGAQVSLHGIVGSDDPARSLHRLLRQDGIADHGVIASAGRHTTTKTRIIAGQQQVTRLDRETRVPITRAAATRLLRGVIRDIARSDAVIVADYGKGVVTQPVLDQLRSECRRTGTWISVDPKPVHALDLRGLSLITPNRKEAFELAGLSDSSRSARPLEDAQLMAAASRLLSQLAPTILLITLGELGMLLCQPDVKPMHVPTVAREVFDVSGAGDTVIAAFTLAITLGASPREAAILANHAAGVVVAKRGTATLTPDELIASFRSWR